MSRTLKVQTPGEAPKQPETDHDTAADPNSSLTPETPPVIFDASGHVGAPEMSAYEMARKIRELEAENLKLKGDAEVEKQVKADLEASIAADERADATITRADRDKYRSMSADKVNPKKLVAAVLTKDGWVAPDQSGQKPKVS
ncbi:MULTISPECIES: hypothetical protein [unclassified Cupriavidus]|uniref:hypothetical protein n=1 Tax=unclassified Cupriavidus TaxID=2640874 RepID=UPI00313C7EB8